MCVERLFRSRVKSVSHPLHPRRCLCLSWPVQRLSEQAIKRFTDCLLYRHRRWADERKEVLETHSSTMAQCPAILEEYFNNRKSWSISLLWDDGFASLHEYMTKLFRSERVWQYTLSEARRRMSFIPNSELPTHMAYID